MELYENWTETKETLLEGLPENKKKILAPLMENQKQYIQEAVANGTSAGAIANFQKIMIPMLRRIIPGTIATELVGTQPMAGPVGLAYSLRFLFDQALDVQPAGAGSEDIAAGDEVFGNNSKTKRFYSGGGNALDANGLATDFPGTPGLGVASSTDAAESKQGRNLRLEVLKQLLQLVHVSYKLNGQSKLCRILMHSTV